MDEVLDYYFILGIPGQKLVMVTPLEDRNKGNNKLSANEGDACPETTSSGVNAKRSANKTILIAIDGN